MAPPGKQSGKQGGSKRAGPKKAGAAKKKTSASKKAPAKKATPKKAARPSKPAATKGAAESRPPETEEYQLGEDFLDHDGDSQSSDGHDEELEETLVTEDLVDEDLPPEDVDDVEETELEEDYDDDDELVEEDAELEELISAETQEWEGLDAAEAAGAQEKERSAVVAAAGARFGKAREKITSGFEAVADTGAGKKITSGFGAVRRWRPGFPIWLRFLTASFLIVFSVAGASSASLILYLGDIAHKLRHGSQLEGVDKFLTQVDGGGPQTILILGSDKRPEDQGTKFKGLSDTTMLLRLDPDRGAIALFSLPRDLKVSIPGYGTDKLNAAYGFGGPQLTLQTVQELTGLQINHLVNVDFEGFARAVNAINCVYVDVDRRYFHSNTTSAEKYEEIDLQPGYQALCGFDALDYARYRHTDNDIVRAARQQEFLREARAKIPPDKLISDRKELISIFTEHTSSDVNDPQTMLQVLKLFLEARDEPIKEVHFDGTLGPSFVTATPQQIHKAVNQFLGIQATESQKGQTAAPDAPVEPEAAPDQTPVAPTGKKAKAALPPPPEPRDSPVGDDTSLTRTSYGKELAKVVRRRVPKLPIYYPTVLETGTDYAQKPRVYKINGTGEGAPPNGERSAYKWVFSRPALGEYYGFQGTRWRDPPILDDPDATKTIGDRDYQIFYDGDRIRMIAWQTDEGSFWVTNTLIESLSDREMLKIAEGMKELPRVG
jgi:LCP family protein required for cell wall assembly